MNTWLPTDPALALSLFWLLPFLVALLLTRLWIPLAERLGFIDTPNHRSLHHVPRPRAGGMAVMVALAVMLAVTTAWWAVEVVWLTVLLALMLAAVFLKDDYAALPLLPRLVAQLVAALGVIFAGALVGAVSLPMGLSLPLGPLAGVFALLVLVWMCNLYNFMDGMDGFAGSMSAIGFVGLALLALASGAFDLAALALAVAGAAAGFLVWNWPPAKVFLGDVGSVPLGFLAAALPLWLAARDQVPLLVGMLPFAPFWLDATVTLGLRAYRRERFWEAHRSHFYQRLVRAGWSHRRTTSLGVALMLISAASALAALHTWDSPAGLAFLILPIAALVAAGAWTRVRESRWGNG